MKHETFKSQYYQLAHDLVFDISLPPGRCLKFETSLVDQKGVGGKTVLESVCHLIITATLGKKSLACPDVH